ncbi:MAG: hypothetical protein KF777_13610 [Planctomycetaceae bacterium]|nr:hypothetical protein [Planctomycetaceae bacterium]
MRTFKDNAETAWTLTVDPFDVKRIQAALGYNLLDLRLSDEALTAWMADPMRMVDTLWLLVSEQAQQQNVTEAEFGRRLRGRLFEAGLALLEELTDFFPLQSQRDELKARLALQLKGMEVEHSTAAWMADRFRTALAASTSSATASSSPESAESVPAG